MRLCQTSGAGIVSKNGFGFRTWSLAIVGSISGFVDERTLPRPGAEGLPNPRRSAGGLSPPCTTLARRLGLCGRDLSREAGLLGEPDFTGEAARLPRVGACTEVCLLGGREPCFDDGRFGPAIWSFQKTALVLSHIYITHHAVYFLQRLMIRCCCHRHHEIWAEPSSHQPTPLELHRISSAT